MDRGYDVFSAHQEVGGDTFSDPKEKLLDEGRRGCDDGLAAAIVAAAHEAQATSPEAELVDRIAFHEAWEALLPPDREVIRMVHDEEMSVEEVAAAVGAVPRTVQRRHARGLRRLRDLLVAGG